MAELWLIVSTVCFNQHTVCINRVRISTFSVMAGEGETVYVTHNLSICESYGHSFEDFYSEFIGGIEVIHSDSPLGQKCKFCGKIRRKKKEWVYE